MTFPGFRIVERLSESTRHLVERAVRDADGAPVVLKRLRPGSTGAEDVARLRREYEIGCRVAGDLVVGATDLLTVGSMPVLVMPDHGAVTLEARLSAAAMSVEAFLPLAAGAARALAALHAHDAVHGDVTPPNVLVDDAGVVRLIDLGLSQHPDVPALDPMPVGGGEPVEAMGTLSYMSPEQTGHLQQPVDARSDLYSLGVIFYRMLAGRLPFEGRDAAEWVHLHLAATPEPLPDEVPQVLATLVARLLAKTPSERYQSAAGALHDLERALKSLRQTGQVAPFELGRSDLAGRFEVPATLVGREAALNALDSAVTLSVEHGEPGLSRIVGPPGIGKSALARAIALRVSQAGGAFVSGKYDQFSSYLPYATLLEAFRSVIEHLIGQPEKDLTEARQRIAGALGDNAGLIVELVPELSRILGRVPPVPDVGPSDRRHRFSTVFRAFLQALALPSRPLVIFLDDMQWADEATLDVVAELFCGNPPRHLHLVIAYRDGEVGASHPLTAMLRRIEDEGLRMLTVAPEPLTVDGLTELVRAATHQDEAPSRELAAVIHERTLGNPFFARQLLEELHARGLLRQSRGRWTWDPAEVRLAPLAENVVELMIGRLRRLDPSTQRAVQLAAAIGARFSPELVAAVLRVTPTEVSTLLATPLAEGLLQPAGDALAFAHDRIQQAAYALGEPDRRTHDHLAIGLALLRQPGGPDERAFEIANHLNAAQSLIDEPDLLAELTRLNVVAGRKAHASTAYATAHTHLLAATRLFDASVWEQDYDTAFETHLLLSECDYLTGRFDESEAGFQELLGHCRGDLDRGRVCALRLRLYQISGRFAEGYRLGVTALVETFDERVLLAEDLSEAIERERARIAALLGDRAALDLLDLPRMADPRSQVLMSLLAALAPCAYLGRPEAFPLVPLWMVRMSLEHGNAPESCFAYSMYAMLLVSVLDDIPAGYAFSRMSIELVDRVDAKALRGMVLHIHANHINVFNHHYPTSDPFVSDALAACRATGNAVHANYAAFMATWLHLERGLALDRQLALADQYIELARESRNRAVLQTIRLLKHLLGELHEPSAEVVAAFDEQAARQEIADGGLATGLVFHDTAVLLKAVILGDVERALPAAAAAESRLAAATALPLQASFYFLRSLALAMADPPGDEGLDQMVRDAERLAHFAQHCPANFRAKQVLVEAEIARLRGQGMDALGRYEEAVRCARAAGALHEWGLARELQGRFLHATGSEALALTCFREAHRAYARWGARAKCTQLDRAYPLASPVGTISSSHGDRVEQVAVMTALKASQAISEELEVGQLSNTLIRLLLQHAGAERGLLLFDDDHGLHVQTGGTLRSGRVLPVAPEQSEAFPSTLVRYVLRTRERVHLADGAAAGRFALDPYFTDHAPRSVLCAPIVRHDRVLGAVYLENRQLAGAFTAEKLLVLDLLIAQVGISMENARLFGQALEAKRIREERDTFKRMVDFSETFVGVLGHDLRNPLAAIRTSTELLQAQADDPRLNAGLDRIRRSADRMGRMIEQILQYTQSRLGGGIPLERQRTDLAQLCRDAIDEVILSEPDTHVELTVDGDASGHWDSDRMAQVISNLVANSVQHTADGRSTVRLDARSREQVLLEVRNAGTIEPDLAAAIFEPFQRGNSARRGRGLGLGLYITRNIVEAHGGTVSVETTHANTTIFRVSLPRATGPTARVTPAAPPPVREPAPDPQLHTEVRSLARPKPTILVAGENPDMREYVSRLLEIEAYGDVATVPNGVQALERVQQRPPDLILADVGMSGLDGLGLLRALLAEPSTAHVPVILLASRHDENVCAEAIEAGAQDYLVQPFSSRELLARVATHLEIARLRREAESARERMVRLFLRAPVAILVVEGPEHRIALANAAFTQLTGRDQLPPGQSLVEVFPELREEHLLQVYDQVYRTGETVTLRNSPIRLDDGTGRQDTRYFTLVIQPTRGASQEITGVMVVGYEVTEHVRAVHELEETRTRLEATVGATSVATWVWDIQTDTVYGDERLWSFFGIPAEQGRAGLPLADFGARFHPDDKARVEALIGAAIASGEPYQAEYRVIDGRGHVRWVLARGRVEYDANGAPVRFPGALYETTTQRETEQALAEAQRAKHEFLALLGHELRNPLAPIVTALELLRMRGISLREVETIERQVSHLRRLIDDLLDVSRVIRGKIQLELRKVEMSDLIRRAVKTASPTLEARQQQLLLDVPEAGLLVSADEGRMAQVIANLLTNAARFSDVGSRIWVTAAGHEGQIEVSVADEGVGIAPQMLERVFDMFQQADPTIDRGRGGLGLGLTIARSLVERHGGAISARSDGLGQGSVFTFRLPAASATHRSGVRSRPAAAQAPAHDDRTRPAARVLIVDDNADAADTLSDYLKLAGCITRVAYDGPSALNGIEEFAPDVAILDLGLPVMDGYELAMRLRATPETAETRLIALSGYAQPSDRERSKAAGFDLHLAKPVSLGRLTEVISSLDDPG